MALNIDRILTTTDFSDGAARAVEHAVSLARQYDAALRILHVGAQYRSERTTRGGGALLDAYRNMREAEENHARALLDDVAANIRAQHPGLTVETELRGGVPHDEIVAAAKESGADMIVLGSHGLSGLRHAFVGSTAERVVRLSSVPVLVVPQGESRE